MQRRYELLQLFVLLEKYEYKNSTAGVGHSAQVANQEDFKERQDFSLLQENSSNLRKAGPLANAGVYSSDFHGFAKNGFAVGSAGMGEKLEQIFTTYFS